MQHICHSTVLFCLYFFKVDFCRAAGNRHALSFQGLVKGLDSQMERKYESIHLSLPFVCLCFLSFLFFSRVCLSWLSISPFLFYLRSALMSGFQTGTSERRLCHFTLFSRAVCLNLSWPSTLAISSSYFCASISVPLFALLIPFFTFLNISYIREPCGLSGSLRCMRGTVFTVYSLFLWSCQWATIGFPERFIAGVVWCFPHTTTRYRSV